MTLLRGKIKIKKGQTYRQIGSNLQVLIVKPKGDKWQAKVLTEKAGVYNGTHSLSTITIYKNYELII